MKQNDSTTNAKVKPRKISQAAAQELLAALKLAVRGDGTAANPLQHDIHFTAWEMTQIRAAINAAAGGNE